MTFIKKLKGILFPVLVVLAYGILFIIKPQMGVDSVKNSGYYIKEMIMIMPVIFILTALLDTWVKKETIIRYLGKDAGMKGILLSFVLGGISAGPIYAAFPFCVMLRKKGASIRNIVIILSAWAVIKLPMLINEVKFLGAKFMAIRWVLTVIAIILFSRITSILVKERDLPAEKGTEKGITLNQPACMGCAMCAKSYPELFEMQNKKACVKGSNVQPDTEKLKEIIEKCPVNAIVYHNT